MKPPKDYKKVTVIGGGFIGYSWSVVFARNGRNTRKSQNPGNAIGQPFPPILNTLRRFAR